MFYWTKKFEEIGTSVEACIMRIHKVHSSCEGLVLNFLTLLELINEFSKVAG